MWRKKKNNFVWICCRCTYIYMYIIDEPSLKIKIQKITHRLRRLAGLPDAPLPPAPSPVSIFSELLKNFRMTAATFSFDREDIFSFGCGFVDFCMLLSILFVYNVLCQSLFKTVLILQLFVCFFLLLLNDSKIKKCFQEYQLSCVHGMRYSFCVLLIFFQYQHDIVLYVRRIMLAFLLSNWNIFQWRKLSNSHSMSEHDVRYFDIFKIIKCLTSSQIEALISLHFKEKFSINFIFRVFAVVECLFVKQSFSSEFV